MFQVCAAAVSPGDLVCAQQPAEIFPSGLGRRARRGGLVVEGLHRYAETDEDQEQAIRKACQYLVAHVPAQAQDKVHAPVESGGRL
jgi:hypothetical protein